MHTLQKGPTDRSSQVAVCNYAETVHVKFCMKHRVKTEFQNRVKKAYFEKRVRGQQGVRGVMIMHISIFGQKLVIWTLFIFDIKKKMSILSLNMTKKCIFFFDIKNKWPYYAKYFAN